MRHPAKRLLLLISLALFAITSSAWADDRAEARTHYQAGVKMYNAGKYQDAIKEFSTAQQLVPADLNNYNLALCYDKLGEAEPAIQYYRDYLAKVPNADKRAEIEASISRLEAALKSASAKKAEEQRKAEEVRKAEEAKKAEEQKRAAAAAAGAGAGAGAGTGAGAGAGAAAGVGVSAGVGAGAAGAGVGAGATVGVGSTGEPATGQAISTGDAQLDRAQAIDINAIRDQRVGAGGSGMIDNRMGPQGQMGGQMGGPPPQGQGAVGMQGGMQGGAQAQPQGQGGMASTSGQPMPGGDKPTPKETPVYKKWWFWAVVAVSAYVVYEIATQDSQRATAREAPHTGPAHPDGVTLFRF